VIGLDTNVLVRYVVKDDAEQLSRVRRLLDDVAQTGDRIYVDDIILCELVWVLRSIYRWNRVAIAQALEEILGIWVLVFADPERFSAATGEYRDGPGDFADYLIGRRNAAPRCEHTVTFDRDLAAHPSFVVL
jgi:predicted nucleic-acid-binding protein